LAKRLWLTILLAALIYGSGHIYLGFTKRGIIILIFGVILTISIYALIPFPPGYIILLVYAFWQIYDAYLHYKKLNLGKTQVPQ
jgi:TM2 domain-containing membrane protein YozV